jgi:hypothetical protein
MREFWIKKGGRMRVKPPKPLHAIARGSAFGVGSHSSAGQGAPAMGADLGGTPLQKCDAGGLSAVPRQIGLQFIHKN